VKLTTKLAHPTTMKRASRADQQDAGPVDRRHATQAVAGPDAERGQHGLAPAQLGLEHGEARQGAHPGIKLGVLDRQGEDVVGTQRQGVGRDRRRILGRGGDGRQMAGFRVGLDVGHQRHAVFGIDVDQDQIGARGRQRGHHLGAGRAAGDPATPALQPLADELERLARALQNREIGR
jgi:hypothetical protein